MTGRLLAILCLLSLSACGGAWRATPPPAAPATSQAPEIPVPLPRAESFSQVKPPVRVAASDAIESHVWAWTSRQIESGQLAAPPGPLTPSLDRATKAEAQSVGALASRVARLVPLTQLEAAQEALHYYEQRYGIAAEFRPVVVAVAPVNEMLAFRAGARVGAGTIDGVFYVPNRDAWLGPIDREALSFTFGTPYVIFLDEAALAAGGLATTSLLVHELKHYLDYRRDPSASPTYAEPAPISVLRARVKDDAQVKAAWESERQSPEYHAFVEEALVLAGNASGAREVIEKKYADYFSADWRTHLPYLLRPGEVSAFLEQVRFYKYWLNESEAQVIDALTSGAPAPAGSIALPATSLTREYFRILYRAA